MTFKQVIFRFFILSLTLFCNQDIVYLIYSSLWTFFPISSGPFRVLFSIDVFQTILSNPCLIFKDFSLYDFFFIHYFFDITFFHRPNVSICIFWPFYIFTFLMACSLSINHFLSMCLHWPSQAHFSLTFLWVHPLTFWNTCPLEFLLIFCVLPLTLFSVPNRPFLRCFFIRSF